MVDASSNPLVSVIVTFYNQERYVGRALKSVQNQTYPNLEIIAVDDGSSDETGEEIRRFSDKRMRFIQQENGGVACARNRGIDVATGEYVAFLDGDDVWLPSKIDVLVSRLRGNGFPACAMVSGYYEVSVSGKLVSKYGQKPRVTNPKKDAISAFPNMRPSMVIYHRIIFKDFGGFPEALKINEDGAFNLRVFRKYPIHCIPELLVFWQGDDEGKSRKVLRDYDAAYQTMENKVAYLRQWIGEADAVAYRKLHIRNNLCGFLSIGRLDVAREWMPLIKLHAVLLDTLSSKLAAFSVRMGVNMYRYIRIIHKLWSKLTLRSDARECCEQLNRW